MMTCSSTNAVEASRLPVSIYLSRGNSTYKLDHKCKSWNRAVVECKDLIEHEPKLKCLIVTPGRHDHQYLDRSCI